MKTAWQFKQFLVVVVLLFAAACGYALPDEDFNELSANSLAVNNSQTVGISTQSISSAGTAINKDKPVVAVTASSTLLMTSTPTIANGINGQQLRIVNAGTNHFSVQDQGTLASSNLRLPKPVVDLGQYESIDLLYVSGSGWYMVGGGNDDYSLTSQSLSANSDTIVSSPRYVSLSATANRTMTSTPTVALGKTGQPLTIFSTDFTHTIVLRDATNLASKLKLRSQEDRVLNGGECIDFVFDGTYWVEVSAFNPKSPGDIGLHDAGQGNFTVLESNSLVVHDSGAIDGDEIATLSDIPTVTSGIGFTGATEDVCTWVFVNGVLQSTSGASCPFVYIKIGDKLEKQGEIIYKKTPKSNEGTTSLPLKLKTNRIWIHEEDDEQSFIDELTLVCEITAPGASMPAYSVQHPTWISGGHDVSLLSHKDGKYLETKTGDKIEVRFPAIPVEALNATIVSTGYYLPGNPITPK